MGLSEFTIPRDFRGTLFEFQKAAVQIAAHHINKRGGVLIEDVVGPGKTLMATAVARIFEDAGLEILIICPRARSCWISWTRRRSARGSPSVGGGIDLRRKVSHRGLIAWTADRHVDERVRRRDLLVVPVPDHADVALRITRGDGRRTLRLGVSPTKPT